jgi:hypothetical protein
MEAGPRALPHPSPTSPARYAEDLAAMRRTLGDDAFAAAWAQGRAMTLQDAARSILSDQTVEAPLSVGSDGRD